MIDRTNIFIAITELIGIKLIKRFPFYYVLLFRSLTLQLMLKKIQFIATASLLIILGSSCHSLRNITSRDSSGSAKVVKKKPTQQLTFIEDIEMLPGGVVVTRHKTSGINNQGNTYHYSEKGGSSIDDANWLQFKYAIITDINVENLTNVPLLQKIDEWWGTKYCIGGETKDCIDCSGFSGNIFREVYNINLPRTASDQYNACHKIEIADMKEGDLVFFHTARRQVSHVGIYIGNNKFVHASTSEGVTISDLGDSYWQPRFLAAGRVRKG